MRTEDLIETLAGTPAPAGPRRPAVLVALASAVGLAAALAVVAWRYGARPDLAVAWRDPLVLSKLALALATAVLAGRSLSDLMRPGRALGARAAQMLVPAAILAVLAGAELARAAPEARTALMLGSSWSACLTAIVLVALLPFAALLLAMRRAAPTDLGGTGFAAGLLSGALAALAYQLHCTEDALPFVASWYVGAMLIVGLAARFATPFLVRW